MASKEKSTGQSYRVQAKRINALCWRFTFWSAYKCMFLHFETVSSFKRLGLYGILRNNPIFYKFSAHRNETKYTGHWKHPFIVLEKKCPEMVD